MNRSTILIASIFIFLFATNCKTQQIDDKQSVDGTNEVLEVEGKITHIQNGKDGYTATLLAADNKTYFATISRVNLSKNNKEYRLFTVGETITVKGSFWTDKSENIHITVSDVHQ